MKTLTQILSTITKPEGNRLKKIARSPYFNQRQDVIDLIETLLENKQVGLEENGIFKQIYSKQPFRSEQWYKLKSLTLNVIEQFLILESQGKDAIQAKIHLASIYRQRRLPDLYQRTMRKAKTIHGESLLRNIKYWKTDLAIQEEELAFSSGSNRLGDHNLQSLSDTYDLSFIIKKLRIACLMLAHQTVNPTEHHIELLEPILDHIREKELQHHPALAIYLSGYQSLMHPDQPREFYRFRDLLFEHDKKFPQEEIRDLFLLAINFCIQQLNSGNLDFFSEGLTLYKEGLSRGYLLENGRISRFTYYNCLGMALNAGELDWAEWFIYHYRDFLRAQFRDTAFYYCLTRLEYQRKNYGAALEHLQKADFSDLLVNLSAKIIQMKIYYEMDEDKLLQSHLDSMTIFLNRKKMIGYHKKNFKNVITYTKKLLKVNPFEKSQLEKLKHDISNEENLLEKEWLLIQLENF